MKNHRSLAIFILSLVFGLIFSSPLLAKTKETSSFVWPTESKKITQLFSSLRHSGIDIEGKSGQTIVASQDGTVKTAKCGWNGGRGCYVVLQHENGISTYYFHLVLIDVKEGQSVKKGEKIGSMGSTGKTFGGPQLHFEIHQKDKAVNPMKFF